MASLQGLPPLPKSLSGLRHFSSAQWKELERLHAMRTMIQQDLNRSQSPPAQDVQAGRLKAKMSLDAQLALLRKEMVGLRQLDMSLLCQLWSLNESIQEYKQLLLSPPSNGPWDGSLEPSSCDEEADSPPARFEPRLLPRRNLKAVPETLSSSSSQSSLEFGDL